MDTSIFNWVVCAEADNNAMSADIDIETIVRQFIKNHKDIVNKLKTIDLSVILKYLNNNQKSQLKKRIQNIIDWS